MDSTRSRANVSGYRLEVPSAWFILTEDQRKSLQNGIGPERWEPDAREAIDRGTKLTPAADVHDVDYCVGRTAADRKAADRRFRRNCFRIIFQDAGGWIGLIVMGGLFRMLRRMLFAHLMYRALRIGGGSAFRAATKVDLQVRGLAAKPDIGTDVPV